MTIRDTIKVHFGTILAENDDGSILIELPADMLPGFVGQATQGGYVVQIRSVESKLAPQRVTDAGGRSIETESMISTAFYIATVTPQSAFNVSNAAPNGQ